MATLQEIEAAAEQKYGLPKGTVSAIRGTEVGTNRRFIDNPAEYHYPLNAEGKRIAKHSGKTSTAFGPYGIVESTAAKPGYGVAPLKSKSLEDQVDFSAAYLAGRVKSAGSFEAGLAGYGEGAQYAAKVQKKMGRKVEEPIQVAKGGQPAPSAGTAPATSVLPQASQVAQGGVLDVSGILPGFEAWLAPQQPQAMAQQQMPVIPDMPVAKDYWGEYLASLQSQGNKPVTSIFDMQQPPDFFSALAGLVANDPNFEEFGGLG